ncbi:MAG TPA: hypothetical protein VGH28_05850 [Polyangiaceae bacterium]|jgi:hypothetical protein
MSRLGLALGLSFLVVACDATDPGVEGLTRGEFTEAGSPIGDGAPPSGDAAKDGASSEAGDGAAVTTAFTGEGAFASNPPTLDSVTQHNNDMVGITPDKTQDCLSCHKMGGAGPEFLFAGSVSSDTAGNNPAAGVEIRVRGSDGKAFSAYSDAEGNFWYEPKAGESLAFPAQAGVRDGTNTALQKSTLSASSCNAGGCHDGTTQAYLHLP